MSSGGLSIVTPPRVKESPTYSSEFQSPNRSNVLNRTKPKPRSNDSEKMKSLNEMSNDWHLSDKNKANDTQLIRKRSDSYYRKRRHSFGTNSDQKYPNQKRRKGRIILPTKFLLGGNITDPLNLSSLANGANQVTPQSSPLPTPKHKTQVEVRIPANINDPLNLYSNEEIDESSLISPKTKNKTRKRKRKRTDSETTAEPDAETPIAPTIEDFTETKKSTENVGKHQKLRFSEGIKSVDKIVSPVIPQGIGPKHRRFADHSKTNTESEQSVNNNETKSIHKKYKKNRFRSKEPKFREKDDKFRFGNYNRYYGYRNINQKDSRLECLKKEWFENKDVLDIGCNVGHVTLAIANNFEPKKIIGLDIDNCLIKTANKNVRHYITSSVLQTQDFPISLPLFHGPLASSVDKNTNFPKNVCFITGNYVSESEDSSNVHKQQFDAILCLSLTKWIHLNWGDSGVKTLFKRIFSQLRPNGKLILEAQPFSSYKKKKKMNVSFYFFHIFQLIIYFLSKETTLKNFNSIEFRPEQFNEYLLSREVGFSQSELIGTPANPSKGI